MSTPSRSRGAFTQAAWLTSLLLAFTLPAHPQATVGAGNPPVVPPPTLATNLASTNLVLRSTNSFSLPTNSVATVTNRLSDRRNARPQFRPVTQPVPAVRLTGGSRGSGAEVVTLDVLAPAEVGLTTREQPSLFWFQSQPSPARLELAVLEDNRVEPLCHLSFNSASQSGIQRLDLAAHGVRLTPGVEYQWIVALVSDPDNRSTDLVASGFIQRVEPDAALESKILAATPDTLPSVLAENGFWYDAIAELSHRLQDRPDDAPSRNARQKLLREAGLVTPALVGPAVPEPAL
jgi:hypothetical protein